MGRLAAHSIPFGETRDEIVRAMAEAQEATRLHASGEPLAIDEVPDISPALGRLRVSGALSAEELRGIESALSAAKTLRRSLHTKRLACPALFDACSTDPTLDDALGELSRTFEADGTRVPNLYWAQAAIGAVASKTEDTDRRLDLQREAGKLLAAALGGS